MRNAPKNGSYFNIYIHIDIRIFIFYMKSAIALKGKKHHKESYEVHTAQNVNSKCRQTYVFLNPIANI